MSTLQRPELERGGILCYELPSNQDPVRERLGQSEAAGIAQRFRRHFLQWYGNGTSASARNAVPFFAAGPKEGDGAPMIADAGTSAAKHAVRGTIGHTVQQLWIFSGSREIVAYGVRVGVPMSAASKPFCGYPIDIFGPAFHACDVNGSPTGEALIFRLLKNLFAGAESIPARARQQYTFNLQKSAGELTALSA